MVWSHLLAKKSLVGGEWVGGRPNLMYSPGPGLWSLVLGPSGPDLDLTWDLDLDLSLTIQLIPKASLWSWWSENQGAQDPEFKL